MMIDLNNLKEQIQTLLQNANTTTASIYLSNNLETKVQRVLKVNPARIPVQASWYPFVTCMIDSKKIEPSDFVKDQATAKRKASIRVKVIGSVWNSTVSDEELDPADEDCEKLMESVEAILRADPTIAGTSTWQFPSDVTYHNIQLDEETHIRAG